MNDSNIKLFKSHTDDYSKTQNKGKFLNPLF